MKPLELSESVQAPIEVVFEIASDIPRAAERMRGIEEIEMLTEGPVGEGTRWKETRIMFGRRATEEMWITRWDPPRGYVVEAESCGCHYRTVLQFDEIGPEETRVTFSFTGTPRTMVARVMMMVFAGMRKMLIKCITEDLQDIKSHAESAARAGDA